MVSCTWEAAFLILTIITLCWVVYISARKRIDPPLPPGPMGLPVVGSLPFLGPELHTYFTDLSKRYGPVFSLRLGLQMGVVVSSPSAAKQVLKDMGVVFATHAVLIAGKEITYGGLDLLWRPYGREWRTLRKVVVREMLGTTALDAVYKLRKHEIQETMRNIAKHSGCPVNIGDQMFQTTMNMATSMLWGDTIKGEEKLKLDVGFRAVVSEIADLVGLPNLSDYYPALARFDLQGIVKKMRVCMKKLDDIFEGVIDRRWKMDKVEERRDFLQVLLDLKDARDDSNMPFTMVHIKALFMDMIVAGTDTISNTLEFAMAELLNNPEVMRLARLELHTLLGGSNASLEESDILRLPYLQAIMKETLRLHPVFPFLIPHCASESCVVGGYTIPKESWVFLNVWAIHRDPSLWEDPLEFKPERFLDRKYDFNGNDFSYFPFGSGRRICVGVAMAERMVLYSLALLLHCFDWQLPEGVEKVDLDERFGIMLKKKTPLLLVPSPREVIIS